MAAELPRPGVEVIQVFRSVSPTIVTPTLVPCVVGVCKQIVEVLTPTSSGSQVLNSQALVTLPGFFTAAPGSGSPPKYTGLDGLNLVLSIDNGPAVTIPFSDPLASGLSPATVVSQINAAFLAAGVTAATAETIGSDRFRIRTIGVGEFEMIKVLTGTSPSVLAAFGIAIDKQFVGLTTYSQFQFSIPQTNFPDPRNNLSQLAIQNETIRVFLALGNGASLRELLRTESFLRNGGTATAAVLTGSVDLTTLVYGGAGTLDADTLTLQFDGGANVVVTFVAPASAAAVVSQINSAVGATVASLSIGNFLVLTSTITGASSSVKVVSGTGGSVADLGFTNGQTDVGEAAVSAIDDGNGDALTPLVQVNLANFTTAASAAVKEGTVDITAGGLYGGGGTLAGKTLTLSDGRAPQTYTFPSGGSALANVAALLVALNAFFGTAAGGKLVFTQGGSGGNKLVITHTDLGVESHIEVAGVGVSVSTDGAVLLGLITLAAAYPTITRGNPFPPLAGDELYVDGVLLGKITQVAPGAVVSVLKIDKQIPIDADLGATFYIIAKNLSGAQTSTRPSADLIVDLNGTPTLKHEVLRDTTGTVIVARASVYLQYTAVRKDVTSLAQNPGLLRFSDTTAIDNALSPIRVDNPLALGLFFAQLNAPGIEITGLGVDSVSADAPFGTVEAFTRAAEFLEGFEVYGIAPLTHDQTVAQVFNTHVTVMSDPANKGERIVLFNPSQPTSKLDTLVASGTSGQSSTALQFDTGVNNLSALLLNEGINPVGTIPASDGVFLDISQDAKKYSVASVSGSVVTIRVTFASEENDDNFYATTDLNDPPLPGQLINEPFAIRIRGASLTLVDGSPDKSGIAATYQGLGQTFLNRRFWQIVPDKCAATIGGLEQVIDGFYLCAAIVGMIGQQPPQQSFTNFPMTGFTQVNGSNDFFSEKQLNIIAAGGNYVVVQDTPGAPLISRMALTTDLTSIETRTDSVNKVVDFAAKFLRRGLKNFIGRFNITQGFLDSLGHVIQGLLDFLVQTGVLIGATLNNIVQDEDAPDTVLVDITLDVPFPCNYIRLTLVI